MKIKLYIFSLLLSCLFLKLHAQKNDEIELILNNHNWTLVDQYLINQNKDVLSAYEMVFTNAKDFWRSGYRVNLKNNGELTAGDFPLCGTGPQVWSSLSGYWEILKDDIIEINYTDNTIHYMNMAPLLEDDKINFIPRKEIYKIYLINDELIGLNPVD